MRMLHLKLQNSHFLVFFIFLFAGFNDFFSVMLCLPFRDFFFLSDAVALCYCTFASSKMKAVID